MTRFPALHVTHAAHEKSRDRGPGFSVRLTRQAANQTVATGILPIFACHSFGPVWCTEVPFEST
ncbi:hypothetical protein, partial [Paraburkholderia sp. SIMBA_054]|uniref:hypothetical protein n=1 Tax=Paraburkholderia sp. SIMBA_054 TaxID=3085795 RepID=UPI00397C290F